MTETFGQNFSRNFSQKFGEKFSQNFGQMLGQKFGQKFDQTIGQNVGQNFGQNFGQKFGQNFGLNFVKTLSQKDVRSLSKIKKKYLKSIFHISYGQKFSEIEKKRTPRPEQKRFLKETP